MTAHQQPTAPSPWIRIARDAANQWFRDNPGAPIPEFHQWAADYWTPVEFFQRGFGWTPGHTGDPTKIRAALAAADTGLAQAVEDEARRRRNAAA